MELILKTMDIATMGSKVLNEVQKFLTEIEVSISNRNDIDPDEPVGLRAKILLADEADMKEDADVFEVIKSLASFTLYYDFEGTKQADTVAVNALAENFKATIANRVEEDVINVLKVLGVNVQCQRRLIDMFNNKPIYQQ